MNIIPNEIDTLPDALRWAREQKGMTLRAVARALGISAPFWSDVEHGRRRPADLEAVAKLLDVSQLALAKLRLRLDYDSWAKKNPEMAAFLEEMKNKPKRCHCPWCRVWP